MDKRYVLADLDLNGPVSDELVVALRPFFRGLSGAEAGISADADNAITTGSDDGLYTPTPFALLARFGEIAADETAKAQARANIGLDVIDGGVFT